jgi:Rhodanese-like domain
MVPSSRRRTCALYEGKGVTADKEVVAYCRIGERSSHTWFVLTYLLGYPAVRNYGGSWTEWGSLIDAPQEEAFAMRMRMRGSRAQGVRHPPRGCIDRGELRARCACPL